MAKGMVLLVGAGPGDPGLLTLKAAEALKSADVILHDMLVSPQVLALARPEAEKIPVGKKGYGPSCRQSEINALMVKLAGEGRRVLRLKGGDPLIFSRAGEEIAMAKAAGIPVEVIPGVTAAQAVGAMLALPLTHRDHARRLQYVTGHDSQGGLPADIDWRALADPTATTIVYMPKRTLAALAGEVITHGLPANTPALAMMDSTLPTQRLITGTVGDLPQRMEEAGLDGPVTVIIGGVCGEISG
ncbi:MAG: uroporphyrinogen-III C-methyltransferase [Pseudomonadota bacterium]|nr:uroporphyrinogen-III C-methyltransferase [Pseudomonadota bacterium]